MLARGACHHSTHSLDSRMPLLTPQPAVRESASQFKQF